MARRLVLLPMNEITYNLCHTSIIGFFKFITNLCGFPNVFEGESIDLENTESISNISFEVSVPKEYLLELVINDEGNMGELKKN